MRFKYDYSLHYKFSNLPRHYRHNINNDFRGNGRYRATSLMRVIGGFFDLELPALSARTNQDSVDIS